MASMMVARMVPAMDVTMVKPTAVLMDSETVEMSVDMTGNLMDRSRELR